jgi:galactokinase
MDYEGYRRWLNSAAGQILLGQLYGRDESALRAQTARYEKLLNSHRAAYGAGEGICLISAPGRTEIVGNHTDHNRGRVLAAAVNLDTLALASPRGDLVVRLISEGYAPLTLDLGQLEPKPGENGTTAALIRGVADRMSALGFVIGGFNAVVTSQVMPGSGLSSSAAFEVAIAAVFDALFNGFNMGAGLRAQVGQYAENVHFGKPSGLMDQMASSVGGLVAMDFAKDSPEVEALSFSFAASGFRLVVADTRGNHGDLTPAYSAIQSEMQAAARAMGAHVLRERGKEDFIRQLPEIREKAGDRAVLRALHFYNENERVGQVVAALEAADLDQFFSRVTESGLSSWMLLQNLYAEPKAQPLALALAVAREVLKSEGACRVHGGGFAGTTLNFVPSDKLEEFTRRMDSLFGPGSCYVLDVRAVGATLAGPALDSL